MCQPFRQTGPSPQPPMWTTLGQWKGELFCFSIGTLTLLGLILLLALCNQKNSPDTPLGINVNAIASVLATITYLCITIPITSCLSQLKWNQYNRGDRSLKRFQDYDQASRGVPGAFLLFFRVPWRGYWDLLGLLAAFNFLCIQAIGPFIQLVVTSEQRSVEIPNVALVPGLQEVSRSIVGIYETTFVNVVSADVVKPVCPFGNCTFDPFWSLAFNAECVDATALLHAQNKSTTTTPSPQVFLLPNGHLLDEAPGRNDFSHGAFDLNISSRADLMLLKNRTNVIVGLSMIYHSRDLELNTTNTALALECVVELVAEYATTSIVNGVYNRTVQDRAYFGSSVAGQNSPWAVANRLVDISSGAIYCRSGKPPCFSTNNATMTLNGTQLTVLGRWTETLSGAMIPCMHGARGFVSTNDSEILKEISGGQPHIRTVTSGTAIDPIFAFGTVVKDDSNSQFLFDIRKRLNSATAQITEILGAGRKELGKDIVYGTASTLAIFTVVQWPWICLPIVLQVLSATLLIGTMWQTHFLRVPIWKDSALAVLARGLTGRDQHALTSASTLKQLGKLAKDRQVILSNSGGPRKLMLVAHPNSKAGEAGYLSSGHTFAVQTIQHNAHYSIPRRASYF